MTDDPTIEPIENVKRPTFPPSHLMPTHDCRKCRFLDRETAQGPTSLGGWQHICTKRGGMANMKSFPFHNTKCQVWQPGKLKPLEERKLIPGGEPT